MIQEAIVLLIFLAAVAWVLFHTVRAIRRQNQTEGACASCHLQCAMKDKKRNGKVCKKEK